MIIPSYTITNLTIDYLIKIELAVQDIKSTKLPREHLDDLTRDIFADELHSVGQLVGFNLSMDDAQKISEGKVLPSKKEQFRLFSNYRSALEFVQMYTPEDSLKPSTELMMHINQLVLDRIAEQWELATFRNFSDAPIEEFDDWYKYKSIYPNQDLSHFFEELILWVTSSKDKTHKLIKTLIFIYQAIDRAPLLAGNQLTTLIMTQIFLKTFGYSPHTSLLIARPLTILDESFDQAMKLTRSEKDLTPFIEGLLYAISLRADEIRLEFSKTFDKKVREHGKLTEIFNKRQIKMLDYMENTERISRQDYHKITGVSFMTAYRDLQDLVEKGYLESKGVGRGTYYTLKDDKQIQKKYNSPKLEVFGAKDG